MHMRASEKQQPKKQYTLYWVQIVQWEDDLPTGFSRSPQQFFAPEERCQPDFSMQGRLRLDQQLKTTPEQFCDVRLNIIADV